MEIVPNVIIPVITTLFTIKATFYFKEREYRKKFIIKKNYDNFVNLRNNLKEFFTEAEVKYDTGDYLTKNKKKLKDIRKRLEINFVEYSKKQKKEGIFCNYNMVELYLDYIKKFEDIFLKDIREITKLSPSNIKKIAVKIENIYLTAKKEEHLFVESLQDESGQNWIMGNKEDEYSGYVNFKKCAYWGECWLEILPLLKKLEHNLENIVDLKKF